MGSKSKQGEKKDMMGGGDARPDKKLLLEGVTHVDVLSGRGGFIAKTSGNVRYRKIIDHHRASYLQARKHDKLKIAKECVRLVHDAGGRFLEWSDESQRWVTLKGMRPVDKTSQALREQVKEKSGDSRKSGCGDHTAADLIYRYHIRKGSYYYGNETDGTSASGGGSQSCGGRNEGGASKSSTQATTATEQTLHAMLHHHSQPRKELRQERRWKRAEWNHGEDGEDEDDVCEEWSRRSKATDHRQSNRPSQYYDDDDQHDDDDDDDGDWGSIPSHYNAGFHPAPPPTERGNHHDMWNGNHTNHLPSSTSPLFQPEAAGARNAPAAAREQCAVGGGGGKSSPSYFHNQHHTATGDGGRGPLMPHHDRQEPWPRNNHDHTKSTAGTSPFSSPQTPLPQHHPPPAAAAATATRRMGTMQGDQEHLPFQHSTFLNLPAEGGSSSQRIQPMQAPVVVAQSSTMLMQPMISPAPAPAATATATTAPAPTSGTNLAAWNQHIQQTLSRLIQQEMSLRNTQGLPNEVAAATATATNTTATSTAASQPAPSPSVANALGMLGISTMGGNTAATTPSPETACHQQGNEGRAGAAGVAAGSRAPSKTTGYEDIGLQIQRGLLQTQQQQLLLRQQVVDGLARLVVGATHGNGNFTQPEKIVLPAQQKSDLPTGTIVDGEKILIPLNSVCGRNENGQGADATPAGNSISQPAPPGLTGPPSAAESSQGSAATSSIPSTKVGAAIEQLLATALLPLLLNNPAVLQSAIQQASKFGLQQGHGAPTSTMASRLPSVTGRNCSPPQDAAAGAAVGGSGGKGDSSVSDPTRGVGGLASHRLPPPDLARNLPPVLQGDAYSQQLPAGNQMPRPTPTTNTAITQEQVAALLTEHLKILQTSQDLVAKPEVGVNNVTPPTSLFAEQDCHNESAPNDAPTLQQHGKATGNSFHQEDQKADRTVAAAARRKGKPSDVIVIDEDEDGCLEANDGESSSVTSASSGESTTSSSSSGSGNDSSSTDSSGDEEDDSTKGSVIMSGIAHSIRKKKDGMAPCLPAEHEAVPSKTQHYPALRPHETTKRTNNFKECSTAPTVQRHADIPKKRGSATTVDPVVRGEPNNGGCTSRTHMVAANEIHGQQHWRLSDLDQSSPHHNHLAQAPTNNHKEKRALCASTVATKSPVPAAGKEVNGLRQQVADGGNRDWVASEHDAVNLHDQDGGGNQMAQQQRNEINRDDTTTPIRTAQNPLLQWQPFPHGHERTKPFLSSEQQQQPPPQKLWNFQSQQHRPPPSSDRGSSLAHVAATSLHSRTATEGNQGLLATHRKPPYRFTATGANKDQGKTLHKGQIAGLRGEKWHAPDEGQQGYTHQPDAAQVLHQAMKAAKLASPQAQRAAIATQPSLYSCQSPSNIVMLNKTADTTGEARSKPQDLQTQSFKIIPLQTQQRLQLQQQQQYLYIQGDHTTRTQQPSDEQEQENNKQQSVAHQFHPAKTATSVSLSATQLQVASSQKRNSFDQDIAGHDFDEMRAMVARDNNLPRRKTSFKPILLKSSNGSAANNSNSNSNRKRRKYCVVHSGW
eukprot:CAMPEP_0119562426 /NCGR_PEP_ID=MMETSP1352-20130426/20401_1 /TAXON_ID=265584 /ORGANISM="Stauroneis constricta, Strain CCMP1120" /LENGTH=1551 /DNA_ID=CAMNT_0007610827 /DNA_START=324 /DNA_END=4979 /DNA_ORIENTATION=-